MKKVRKIVESKESIKALSEASKAVKMCRELLRIPSYPGISTSRLYNDFFNRRKRNLQIDLDEDIREAIKGSWKSIERLIIWDKRILFQDFVKNKVYEAVKNRDREFFETLGDVIKKCPRWSKKGNVRGNKYLKAFIDLFYEKGYPFQTWTVKQRKSIRKMLQKRMEKDNPNIIDDKEFEFLYDDGLFAKHIKRFKNLRHLEF